MSVLEQNSRKRMMLGQDGNSLTLLIILNAIIFVLLSFIKVIYLLIIVQKLYLTTRY